MDWKKDSSTLPLPALFSSILPTRMRKRDCPAVLALAAGRTILDIDAAFWGIVHPYVPRKEARRFSSQERD